jgi:riboflavin synthase
MFTGIIEEIGLVRKHDKKINLSVLAVQANKICRGLKLGSSICVDGVCLTVTAINGKVLTFDVMLETLNKTTLGLRKCNDKVNMERAIKSNGRLDGHIVTGHIDLVSVVKRLIKKENYLEIQIDLDRAIKKYIVPKGSICVNGVSLTVGEVTKDYFSVYIIPATERETNLGVLKIKQPVNIEVDILARYIEKQLSYRP